MAEILINESLNELPYTHTHTHICIWLVQVGNEMMMNDCLYSFHNLVFRLTDR